MQDIIKGKSKQEEMTGKREREMQRKQRFIGAKKERSEESENTNNSHSSSSSSNHQTSKPAAAEQRKGPKSKVESRVGGKNVF